MSLAIHLANMLAQEVRDVNDFAFRYADTFFVISGITAGLVLIETTRRVVIVPSMRFIQRIQRFLEDWDGKCGDDGHSAVPGVMEQMRTNDDRIGRMEFHLGNGDSVPLREMVETNASHIDALRRQMNTVQETVNHIETQTARLPADRRYKASSNSESDTN